jgi:sulfite reductase (NADPH) flavoprotein alpha-component
LKTNEFPFDSQENQLIEKLFDSLDISKLYWLHGYIQALIQARQDPSRTDSGQMVMPLKSDVIEDSLKRKPLITVLFGTQTGNSRKIASRLFQELEKMGHSVRLTDMADFKNKDIKSEKFLLLIISTQGEGEPPLAAEDFFEFLHSRHSPSLPDLSFAVLALGDKSYFNFCKTGADIDFRLEQLGARRLIPRCECDLDFIKPAEQWINDIIQSLPELTASIPSKTRSDEIQLSDSLPTRDNPIEAIVVNKIKLNGRGSEKNTYHVELQLPSEQMIYQPGDSVGIIPCNNHELVGEMIQLLKANTEMPVVFRNSSGSLGNVLANDVELTKLTRENLENYSQISGNQALKKLTQDINQLSILLHGSTWADLLRLYPGNITAESFLSLARPIQPRLYSISSSARAYPGEVHITVRQVDYNLHGKAHRGVCSTYLAELPETDDRIRIFFETNEVFKLPPGDTDIIMIGPGTGVAPFRAFMQEREDRDAKGKNWLFFGDWCFTTDFLYQTEWQEWKKKSLLHRVDLAFSRDQQEKIYVQHRLVEQSREVFEWIENGATIYVCGDMKKMASDVNKAFVDLVSKEGGISAEKAREYVKALRKQKRYLEDVY